MQPAIKTYLISDTAVTLSFELPISLAAHRLVMLAAQIAKEFLENECCDIVPAYTSLTLYFSNRTKLETSLEVIEKLITEGVKSGITKNDLEKTNANIEKANNELDIIQIPVCYEWPLATDLQLVMEQLQLSQQEIVQRHTNTLYNVYMIGFVPGFAYMGDLDPTLYMPRKQKPTSSVPAGSIAIAANQTGIYPFEVPGGWHIIGRTPLTMFNKKRDPVCLLQPGQRVRFFSISLDEFNNAQ